MQYAFKSIVFALLFTTSATHADTLFGVYAGAGTWQQEFGGEVDSGLIAVDVENDLGLDDDDNLILYVALEHGVPVLPNVRGQHFSIDVDSSSVLSRNIEFNGQVFNVSDSVNTTVEFSQRNVA